MCIAGYQLYTMPTIAKVPSATKSVSPVPSSNPSVTVPTPEAPPPPVLEHVNLFMPVSMDVMTPRGQLNPTRVTIDQGELRATSEGVIPRDDPGVLTDPGTTLPGTGQGTTLIAGHAQADPPMVFNFLSDLTQADVDGGSKVILYGPSGQTLIYQIDLIQLADKETFDTHTEYQDNTPNRLLVITCDLEKSGGAYMDTVQNRVIVAHLVSSKAGL